MAIKDSAKTILCFGDSNTWGANPKDGLRYPRSIRWPSALQKLLGNSYEVISEGLCGRTLVASDPATPHRAGITHLRAILESASPVSLVIIMLGTNDIKSMYGLTAQTIAKHLDKTIDLIRRSKVGGKKKADILVICPPPPVTPRSGRIDPRMARWPKIFRLLPALYVAVAKKRHCTYLNAGDYIASSTVDGYHLDAKAHLKLARAIAARVRKMKS